MLRSKGDIRSLSAPTRHRRSPSIAEIGGLDEFPFLRAALEDIDELHLCASRETPNRRNIVCLMFDAIEFVLYEIMLLHERDIYKTGQNTIGFDDALTACRELGVEVPLIGTVRAIQKQRGDAKHHAQAPDDNAYERLCGNFDIIISRLVNEQFEGVLGDSIVTLPLLSHQLALFESYRRRRNHDWEQAYRFILAAMLRKHREMFGSPSNRAFDFTAGPAYQLDVLDEEIVATDYTVAPRDAADTLNALVAQVRQAVGEKGWERAASLVASAYSTTDRLLPGIFDIKEARRLTAKLYQPTSVHYGKPMAWSKVWGSRDSEEARLIADIAGFFQTNNTLGSAIGRPFYSSDDDRYWRWWEFAIFDGERWHTFQLDTEFHVAVQVGLDSSRDRAALINLLKLIVTNSMPGARQSRIHSLRTSPY